MVKGPDLIVGIGKATTTAKNMTREEMLNAVKKVTNVAKRDVKTVGEIPAENIRATYASQLDAPIISRFKPEPYKIPDFSRLPREKQIELLTSSLRKNAPKTKEEAFARLEHALKELEKMKVEVPKDVVQSLKNDILKKFGG